MLRGVDPAETRANLDAMLAKLRAAGLARYTYGGEGSAPTAR